MIDPVMTSELHLDLFRTLGCRRAFFIGENPSTRDSKTGKPVDDTAALLGALASLNDLSRDNPKWSDWKIRGQELLNSKKSDSTT